MNKPYALLLRDPRWQRKRLEILQRDDFQCTFCGDNSIELHVHHKEYRKGAMPWEYSEDVLVTLCNTCHYLVGQLKANLIRQCSSNEGFPALLEASRIIDSNPDEICDLLNTVATSGDVNTSIGVAIRAINEHRKSLYEH